MKKEHLDDTSLSEVHHSVDTTTPKKKWRKLFSFLGPAYLVSVGYMDPGNWATDIAGGSKYGYALIWVLLMSNLMALLLQGLSARLGIVRGRDLAQANRETYPKYINFILYLLAEIAIAACDLAEVLGMAIGIQLLTGLPLIWGVSITVLDTFLLLYLQKAGIKKMEAFIIALVAIISLAFLAQIILAKPDVTEVVKGFVPSLPDKYALYIAISIIGATVMPHNLYLHSALVQSRKISRTDAGIKQALKFNRVDTTIALNLAFFVNAGILVLAGTVFYNSGNADVAGIKEAHQLLPSFLGNTAPILFAIALIAAGQSSTVTGTLAGQIIMEGYLSLRINPWLRRLITRLVAIAPALIVILLYGESKVEWLLLLSQVILSLQLGFAIIPLIYFVSNKEKMGKFAINNTTKVAACLIATVLVSLNIKLLADEFLPFFNEPALLPKILIIAGALFFGSILLYIIIFPFLKIKQTQHTSIEIHDAAVELPPLQIPVYNKIVVALDFKKDDHKIISFALGQANKSTTIILIHVVESASANLHGTDSDDHETKKDAAQLAHYQQQLQAQGYNVTTDLGFKNRVKEIVRLVELNDADLLVIGAHGHSGVKDILYGETVNAVRHELKIPVLVVTL
ncbi:Nramp family divalent metal transporter [Ferruginibacter yonginensis]|uniref:Divalent metal cation transporter MntH n=1 Tax=Ferruginibacter yonginensis TaxID=1310416 RepID=A0ABV8QTU1_9BACT